jgi:hypothetical protein
MRATKTNNIKGYLKRPGNSNPPIRQTIITSTDN